MFYETYYMISSYQITQYDLHYLKFRTERKCLYGTVTNLLFSFYLLVQFIKQDNGLLKGKEKKSFLCDIKIEELKDLNLKLLLIQHSRKSGHVKPAAPSA